MAIAQVGNWTSGQFTGGTGGTLTGRTSTAGNFVAITATTSDTPSTTFSHSQAGSIQTGRTFDAVLGGNPQNSTIRYIENIVGGASHTITIGVTSGESVTLNATEYSGVATSSSLDKNNFDNGDSTSLLSAATATTTQADELLIGAGCSSDRTNSTWTAGTSFTLRGNIAAGSTGDVSFLEERIVSATGAYTSSASWPGSGGGPWVCQIATFKAASSAAFDPPLSVPPAQFNVHRM